MDKNFFVAASIIDGTFSSIYEYAEASKKYSQDDDEWKLLTKKNCRDFFCADDGRNFLIEEEDKK